MTDRDFSDWLRSEYRRQYEPVPLPCDAAPLVIGDPSDRGTQRAIKDLGRTLYGTREYTASMSIGATAADAVADHDYDELRENAGTNRTGTDACDLARDLLRDLDESGYSTRDGDTYILTSVGTIDGSFMPDGSPSAERMDTYVQFYGAMVIPWGPCDDGELLAIHADAVTRNPIHPDLTLVRDPSGVARGTVESVPTAHGYVDLGAYE
jgi:hypothetical protein